MKLPKKATPGSGKILVGDCAKVLKELPEECADAVIADPPFKIGVEYDEDDDHLMRDEFQNWLVWRRSLTRC
jgi:DNA modification methylase